LFSALLYLQYHSIKNRTLMRLKRLRRPKYLVGGIVGAVYFYFYFFRYLLGRSGPRAALPAAGSPDPGLYESIGACLFFIAVLLAWVVPHERAALAFTEAEVAFLFPAPISRRGLIHFKLLRSQTAILFTTFFLMLVTNRFGGKFWFHAAGWWIILSTLNLHVLGCSFARTMLLDRGITNWQRRLGIGGLLTVFAVAVIAWGRRTFPGLAPGQLDPSSGPTEMMVHLQDYFHHLLVAGPVPYLLFPFRLVIRPYLAPNVGAFIIALIPALLILAAHYWWVLHSNVAFEEASVEASRKLAEKIAAVRSGNWQAANQKVKVRRPPFVLCPTGPPVVALMWKNIISAGQAFSLRTWIMLAILGTVLCLMVSQTAGASGLVPALGMAVGVLLIWSLFLGPQFLRQDFRQDLPLADVLKMYPLPGWQIVLGELLGPALILTSIQWLLVVAGVIFCSRSQLPLLTGWASFAFGFSIAVIAPTINLITLQIPNAAVLLFPAWFQSGKDGPQGIEATGQRIIFVLGQLIVFILALIPAVLAFSLVFFVMKVLLTVTVAIPFASVAAALILTGEASLGLLLLGRVFDRLDVSAEL
jgi:ABC-2 type transport system permease protein